MTDKKEVIDMYNAGAIREDKRDAWLAYLDSESAVGVSDTRPPTRTGTQNVNMRTDTLRHHNRNTQTSLLAELRRLPEFWPAVIVLAIFVDFFIL